MKRGSDARSWTLYHQVLLAMLQFSLCDTSFALAAGRLKNRQRLRLEK